MKLKKRPIVYRVLYSLGFLFICACAGTHGPGDERLSEAKRDIGEAYMRQGDYTAALRELIEAEKMNPEDHLLQNDLGLCYMEKKSMAVAIAHFKKAVAVKPSFAPARNNLGAAYMQIKEWDAAIDVFKEITNDALYGTPHYPLSNLGLAYYHKGQYKTALGYFQKALRIQENFVNALRGAGKTYLALKDGRNALAYLERAVNLAPKIAEIHFELAEANLLVGRTNQAKASYETALDLAPPESDMAIMARQRLRTLP